MQTSSTEQRICRHCGGANESVARFCGSCGRGLNGAAPRQKDAQPGAHGPKKKVCAGCQKLNDAGGAFCFDCGLKLPEEAVVPLYREPAGFWIRLLGYLIDWGVLWLVSALLEPRLGIVGDVSDSLPIARQIELLLPSILLGLLVSMTYETLMVGAWRGTLGKLLLGLRVVRGDGGRVPYGLSMMRWFAHLFSLLPIGFGYVWIGLSPSKRAWHDYLCDTRVMRVAK